MSKSIFFQHPYELEKDERIQNLDKKMPDCGFGVFWKVYHRIRKAGTRYPLSGLMAEIGQQKPSREKRLIRVLKDFHLFVIKDDMVELAPGLTISEINPPSARKSSPAERLEKVHQNIREGYANTLIPDELAQMDKEALEQVEAEVQEQNEKELESYH